MRLYLDASLLVPLVVADAHTARAFGLLQAEPGPHFVSEFGVLEVASALNRKVRTGELSPIECASAKANLQTWRAGSAERAELTDIDITAATGLLDDLALNLRGPDALHLALVRRLGTPLATFDIAMAEAAQRLGISVQI